MTEEILDVVFVAIWLPSILPVSYPFTTCILIGLFTWLFFRFKNVVFLIAAVIWGGCGGLRHVLHVVQSWSTVR